MRSDAVSSETHAWSGKGGAKLKMEKSRLHIHVGEGATRPLAVPSRFQRADKVCNSSPGSLLGTKSRSVSLQMCCRQSAAR